MLGGYVPQYLSPGLVISVAKGIAKTWCSHSSNNICVDSW